MLPGMGKANRRKHGLYLKWAVLVGLVISGFVGLIIYFVQSPGPSVFGP